MRPTALAIAAAASVVVAALLALGYVSRLGVEAYDSRPTGPPPGFRSFQLTVDGGRTVLYVSTYTSTVPRARVSGRHVRPIFDLRSTLNLWRAVWEFDAHTIHMGQYQTLGVYAAPIWCFELPLLVAPLLWLRCSRRRPEVSGFAVLSSDA